jgi:hypothetical protein
MLATNFSAKRRMIGLLCAISVTVCLGEDNKPGLDAEQLRGLYEYEPFSANTERILVEKKQQERHAPTSVACEPFVMEVGLIDVQYNFQDESINHDSSRSARLDRISQNLENWITSLYDDDDRFRKDNPDWTTHKRLYVFEPITVPCRGTLTIESIDNVKGAVLSRAEDFNFVSSGTGLLLTVLNGETLSYLAGSEYVHVWLDAGKESRPPERAYRIAKAAVDPSQTYYPAMRSRVHLRAEDGTLTFLSQYAPAYVREPKDSLTALRESYSVLVSFS